MCKSYSFILLLLFPIFAFSTNSITKQITLEWQTPDTLQINGYETLVRLYFDEAQYSVKNPEIPHYVCFDQVHDHHLNVSASLANIISKPIDNQEYNLIDQELLDTCFTVSQTILTSRGNFLLRTEIATLRYNPTKKIIEKLISCQLNTNIEDLKEKSSNKSRSFANSSMLANGTWYRLRYKESGMYKITGNELKSMGISATSINSANIRLFGNGGGLLPTNNSEPRIDDLAEMAIQVEDGGDGIFDLTDYILFYGKEPTTWVYSKLDETYSHQNHYYDDNANVFLTLDNGVGKRIQAKASENGTPLTTINQYPDYQVIDQDLNNLTNTGRTWFGDLFDVSLSKNYQFDFPNLIPEKTGIVTCYVAGRTMNGASFQLSIDDVVKKTIPIRSTTATGYTFATTGNAKSSFEPSGSSVKVGLIFNRSANTSRGWLDYIEVNVWRKLIFSGSQLSFRNPNTTQSNNVIAYNLENAGNQVSIWDISNPVEPFIQSTEIQSNTLSFKSTSQTTHEFIAFDGSVFKTTEFIEQIENQNLHAVNDIDYLIISHPDFIVEAQRLAEIHRNESNLVVFVTTPQKIYNEFSSGAQDITAIRDFAQKLYSTSTPGRELKYLLLFGDGSFDYKDRIGGNSNFVPTWESIESLDLIGSIGSDDYFGFLDENEGDTGYNLVDIGIGRFPVASVEQASQMVDKVSNYTQKKEVVMGSWRNQVTFIADDGDSNLHLKDAEILSDFLANDHKALNIDKIYLDSYKQIATTGGQKAPDMNQAINNRMEKGSLIMNYSGHGGEIGWGHERYLEIANINSWSNFNMLPVFITATCEFSRYDDPTRVSAGELVILNPKGGAISMFTTSRATYASANLTLNMAIYKNNIFEKQDGEYPAFGDVLRRSKLNGDDNDKKFILLGDPALHLSYPTLNVNTTFINDIAVGDHYDTLRAYDVVKVSGIVTDEFDEPINNYNGVVYPSVYDKAIEFVTYGDQSTPYTYILRNNLIYKGKAAIVNGQFTFSFMLPKDIAYNYGTGRISYYATDYQTDANGYYENIIIGGFNDEAITDDNGPVIKLFMNDTTFQSGDITNETPTLLAQLSDENGINTTGIGIGHDIYATITGATNTEAILNGFYEADLNESTSGTVKYKFPALNPGLHTLTLKAWDVFNNSSEASIEFIVVESGQMALENLHSYPNPFVNETNILFDHNQAGNELKVEVKIYNMTGQLVKKINKQFTGNSFQSEPIKWNGTSDGGRAVREGLYIYSVFVTNENGESSEERSKMLFIR